EGPCLAVYRPRGAGACLSRAARGAPARVSVVDHAVAVVVLTVAHLGDGGVGDAEQGAAHTLARTRGACTRLAGGAASASSALVHLPVAVVVEPVARLCRGCPVADAHELAGLTLLRPGRAHPRLAG